MMNTLGSATDSIVDDKFSSGVNYFDSLLRPNPKLPRFEKKAKSEGGKLRLMIYCLNDH